jgi:hypothetical protein
MCAFVFSFSLPVDSDRSVLPVWWPVPALRFLQELAYKLVSKMGWEEGKGLGKDNKGIVKHIWTKKRNDQVGLGGEVGNDWGAHSIQTNSYNSLLSKLAVITNNSDSESDSDAETKAKKIKATKNGKKDKQGAKESGSDSEAEASKKNKKEKKPKKKTEELSDSDSSDEDLSKAASASCDDYGGARKAGRSYAAAAAKEIKEKKAQTNALRFAYKRAHLNKTKDVKAYSATDLSQILGFSVAPKGEEDKRLLTRDGVKSYGKAGAKTEDASSDDESEKEDKTSKKRKKDAAPEKPKGGIVIGSSKRKPMVLPEPSKLTGVLMHMFSHGGFLSGETKQKEQDWQFDEATQEKIAMDAHNNKVTGKKGLGFDNDRPTKLGKDYTGSKKRFEESDDEKDKAEGESEDESEAERKARRKAEKKAKKAAAAAAAAAPAEEEEEASEKTKKKKKKRAKDEEEEPSEEVPEKKKKKKQKAE